MIAADELSDLLLQLYEAAASPERWPGFFDALRKAADADTAFFDLIDPESRCDFSLSYGFDPAFQRLYAEHLYKQDILLDRFLEAQRTHGDWIGTSQSVCQDDEFKRSVTYNEMMRPQKLTYQCAVGLGGLDGGIQGGLGMHRINPNKPFGQDTIALLAMLAPHLKRALNTHRTLTQQRNQNEELLKATETFELAILSLDSRGRVLRMTGAAQTILDAHDGLEMKNGILQAAVGSEQTRLEALIRGAAATGDGRGAEVLVRRPIQCAPQAGSAPLWTPSSGGAMLVSRRAPKRPLQLVVTPFRSSQILLDEQPAALVFLTDPHSKPLARSSVLRELYNLSPAEARMADLLMQGLEMNEAASQMKITYESARSRLKIVLAKTGTRRQSELMRLILSLPGI